MCNNIAESLKNELNDVLCTDFSSSPKNDSVFRLNDFNDVSTYLQNDGDVRSLVRFDVFTTCALFDSKSLSARCFLFVSPSISCKNISMKSFDQ